VTKDDKFTQLERKAYTAYHQDGLIDILFGMAMIGFGLEMLSDWRDYSFFVWMPLLLYLPLKNRITVPRFGYVKFPANRSASMNKTTAWMIAFVFVAVMTVFVVGYLLLSGIVSQSQLMTTWQRANIWLVGIGVGVIFIAREILVLGIARLYAYIGMTAVILAVGHLLNLQAYVSVFVSGALVMLSGVWLLVQFLRKYPLLKEEAAHVGE
jgi:hypothetical protein